MEGEGVGFNTQSRDIVAHGLDEQAALAHARVWIDVADLGWYGPWAVARHAVADAAGAGTKVDRAHIARHIQLRERVYRRSGLRPPKDLVEFLGLPLSDRLRILDAAVSAYGYHPHTNPGPEPWAHRERLQVLAW